MRLIPTTRGGMLVRFMLGSFVIICAAAATTAVAGLLQFKQLAQDISVGAVLPHAKIVIANPGQAQTILIVGSDHRAGEPTSAANTDTMMLVRLNPNSSTINVMSLPRDLEVQIPGYGTQKLNAAYSEGGTNLLVQTIQQDVFPHFHPNHILDVNFHAFQALTNAIGCVYSDVDHRYYNNTVYDGYSSIDIQPGYQKLCGAQALAFVRFRHTDSDLVRNARQQDFIRWAKDQYSQAQLIANKDRLLRIFGRYVQTDANLRSADGVENLFTLVAFSDGHTIKQIRFPAQLQNCVTAAAGQPAIPCYVTSTAGQEAAAWGRFMKPTTAAAAAGSRRPSRAAAAGTRGAGSGRLQTAGLTADPADGQLQAKALAGVRMPVYYPRLIVSGSQYCYGPNDNCVNPPNPTSEFTRSYPRRYVIHDRSGHIYPAYRMTLYINQALGQYYGVQGTTWQNPPLLSSPQATRIVNGRKLYLYVDGSRLTTVAWHTPQGVYWISNTLTSDIPNRELVDIAASLTRAP